MDLKIITPLLGQKKKGMTKCSALQEYQGYRCLVQAGLLASFFVMLRPVCLHLC